MEGRDDLRDLLQTAARIQSEANSAGMGPPTVVGLPEITWLQRFDEVVTFQPLRDTSRTLFANGHYARAVEEAFKCLNNAVKDKSGLSSTDGDALMRTVFSANKPVLRLNTLRTISEKDEQRGYMDIYAGSITGIRNPRAHEHRLEDNPSVALELLAIANHLMRKLEGSRKTRRRKAQATP